MLALQTKTGHKELSKQHSDVTGKALQTLAHVTKVPEAAQALIKMGLPSFLNDIAPFASQAAVTRGGGPGAILSCIHYTHLAEGGQEQLAQHMEPQSLLKIMSLVLSWVESPGFAQKLACGHDEFTSGIDTAGGTLLACVHLFPRLAQLLVDVKTHNLLLPVLI